MYLSECPYVIQLNLNDKPTNRPESSEAWGSGAGGGGGRGLACSLTVLLASKLLFKYLQANIQSEETKIKANLSDFFPEEMFGILQCDFFVQSRIHIEEAP